MVDLFLSHTSLINLQVSILVLSAQSNKPYYFRILSFINAINSETYFVDYDSEQLHNVF